MAKLGLVSKQALEIFSQNETLRLQAENTVLKQQLKAYIIPDLLKNFCASPEYYKELDRIVKGIADLLKNKLPMEIPLNQYDDWAHDHIFDLLEEFGFPLEDLACHISDKLLAISGCAEFSKAQGTLLGKMIGQIVLGKYEEREIDDEMVMFRGFDLDNVHDDVPQMIYHLILVTIGWDHYLMDVHDSADNDNDDWSAFLPKDDLL